MEKEKFQKFTESLIRLFVEFVESHKWLFVAGIIGAAPAIGLSLWLSIKLVPDKGIMWLIDNITDKWPLYLTVPFIEEACKAAIALFIIKLMAGGAATKTKAMVVALSLGCMFGIVESHIYISVAEASNYEISWWMLIIRWGLCPILHMVATGAIVWGFWDIYGLVHRKGMDLSVVRKAASVMLAGYLIHAMYNLAVYVVECYHMGTL